jgi:hypothetical protein
VTEETKRKTGKAKKKKSGKGKPVINIIINYYIFCHGHICRHRKEEGLGVETPLHNVGEPDCEAFRILFGPGSKGTSPKS